MPGEGRFGIARSLDAEDRVRERGEVSEEEAADSSVELVEAERLSALESGQPDELPAVGEFADEAVVVREFRKLCKVLELEDVGAVEVGRAIGLAKVIGIASREEETDVALLIEGVPIGVRDSKLGVVGERFDHVGLEGVVGGDADRAEESGIGTVADVRNAEVDVTAVEGVVGLGGDGVVQSSGLRCGVENLPPVTGGFTVDGAGGTGNPGLVEGHRDHAVTAEVAGVANGDREVVARLPLHVELEVEGVRELVAHVVGAKVEGRG